MPSRLGDLAQATRLQTILGQTQTRIREEQAAVASGKRTERFAEIADRAAILVAVKADRAKTDAWVGEIDQTLVRVRASDEALGDLGEVAERFRTLLVARLNDATGANLPFDTEVDLMLAEVESRLNVQLDGRYLLAGSRTDTAPVVLPDPPPTLADPSLYYRGDTVRLTARAADGVEVAYGVTADDPALAGLIAALGAAREAHLTSDRPGLSAALGAMDGVIGALSAVRSEIGTAASRLEVIADSQRQTILYLDELTSTIEDTDLPAAVSRISRDSASLEAAYLTISRLNQLSLADYLR
jgi:flagellar hook-associated protein 3 FlgL